MAVYPTMPPAKPNQVYDPTEGSDGALLPDRVGVDSITITAPAAAATVSGAAVAITATIVDTYGTDITKVQFYKDQGGAQTQIGSDDTSGPPWSVTWNTTSGNPDGSYNLQAKATDHEGNVTASPKVQVTVDN